VFIRAQPDPFCDAAGAAVRGTPSPVAIGGVGGSGTRVAASLVRMLGIYLGSDLNPALDNLWFTLLFKRPRWYERGRVAGESVASLLAVFERAMTTGLADVADEADRTLIASAADDIESYPRPMGAGRAQAASLLASRALIPAGAAWGWKEPNTHIFLSDLADFFPRLKYLHVIRHGLDMAFSTNQAQVLNWGHLLLPSGPSSDASPSRALKYWLAANERACALGDRLGADRFLLLRFESLCADPKQEIRRVAEFLGMDVSPARLERLAALPLAPVTSGRYRDQRLDVFDPQDVERVRRFGYPIDAGA
jgi:hypothetical protein